LVVLLTVIINVGFFWHIPKRHYASYSALQTVPSITLNSKIVIVYLVPKSTLHVLLVTQD